MGLLLIVRRVQKKKSDVSGASVCSDTTRSDSAAAAHAQCVSLPRIETTYPAGAHLFGPEGLPQCRTHINADAITIHPLRPKRLRACGNQPGAFGTLVVAT